MPHRVLDDSAADATTIYASLEYLFDANQDEASEVDTDATEITSFSDKDGDVEHTVGQPTTSAEIAMGGLPHLLPPYGLPGGLGRFRSFRDLKFFKTRNPDGGPSELSVHLRLKRVTFIPPKAFQSYVLDYLLQQRAFRHPHFVSATHLDNVKIPPGQLALELPLQQTLDDKYLFPQLNDMLVRSGSSTSWPLSERLERMEASSGI